jgi:uncharacterized Zn ribbon protein
MLMSKENLEAINEDNRMFILKQIIDRIEEREKEIEDNVKKIKDSFSVIFMEKKKVLICEKCWKEFSNNKEAGEHAMKESHYSFKLKGTTYLLSIG